MKNKSEEIPIKDENPKGLHQKYLIRKIIGVRRTGFFGDVKPITEAVDKNAEYFVMRVDNNGKDKKHSEACRKAVLHYAELIKDHLPELSQDLKKRYGNTK